MYLNFLLLKEHSEKHVIYTISIVMNVDVEKVSNYMYYDEGNLPREVEYSYIMDKKEQFKTTVELWLEEELVKDRHPIRIMIQLNKLLEDYILVDFNGLKKSDGLLLISPESNLYETDIEEPNEGYEGTNWINFDKIKPLNNLVVP
jgi:hypothetical protein